MRDHSPIADPSIILSPVPLSLDDIDGHTLIRDRSVIDADGLAALETSISRNGLRLPIEVIPSQGERPYALLSGLRRLTVWRELAAEGGPIAIPAFIRPEMDQATALVAVIEENEMHAPLSPWEQGWIVWVARDEGLYADLKSAARALFPTATYVKISRIRSIAEMVEELGEIFIAPERWSQRRCLRLAAAVRDGFAPLIRAAIAESDPTALTDPTPKDDWRCILPCVEESEALSDYAKPI